MDTTILLPIIQMTFFILFSLFVYNIFERARIDDEKSYFAALINVVLFPIRKCRLGVFGNGDKICFEKLMEAAMKRTQLRDFGDNLLGFVDAHKTISDLDFYKALKFSNIGFLTASSELSQTLVRRLNFIQCLKENPAISHVRIESPVFVFGLGRSGTTYLHRLLALDPEVRSPSMWELVNPIPRGEVLALSEADPELMKQDRSERAKFIRNLIKQRNILGDDSLKGLHEIGADLPEECLFALSNDLPLSFHYMYSCLLNKAAFIDGIPAQQVTTAYASYKKILQLLSLQRDRAEGATVPIFEPEEEDGSKMDEGQPPRARRTGPPTNPPTRRWVLKCPLHIFFLRSLAHVFPDAKMVWAHRHPIPTVSSMCTLLTAMRKLYYEKDREEVLRGQGLGVRVGEECTGTAQDKDLGRRVEEMAAFALTQAPLDLAATGLPCAHVLFDDLVADPLGVVRAVYQQFGWEVSPAFESAVLSYVAENTRSRAAIHGTKANEGGKGNDTNKDPNRRSDKGSNSGAASSASAYALNLGSFGLSDHHLTTGKTYGSYIRTFRIKRSGYK